MRLVQTATFTSWLAGLKDDTVKLAVVARAKRLSLGNAGDSAPVGEGVTEMRIHLGAGWRVYFVRRGERVALLLGGGSKRTQRRVIADAITMARRMMQADDE